MIIIIKKIKTKCNIINVLEQNRTQVKPYKTQQNKITNETKQKDGTKPTIMKQH